MYCSAAAMIRIRYQTNKAIALAQAAQRRIDETNRLIAKVRETLSKPIR